jgi:hypothetical protein
MLVNPDSLFCSEFGLAFKLCGGREPESKNISEHPAPKHRTITSTIAKRRFTLSPATRSQPSISMQTSPREVVGIYVLAAYPTSLFRLNAIQMLFRSCLLRPKPHRPFSAPR